MNPISDDVIMVRELSVVRSGWRVLTDISFTVPRGGVVDIVGPNGAGKSTLLSCIYRHIAYQQGQILIEGRELRTLPRNELARKVAAVP